MNGNTSFQLLEQSVDLFEKPEAIGYPTINKCMQEKTLCFQGGAANKQCVWGCRQKVYYGALPMPRLQAPLVSEQGFKVPGDSFCNFYILIKYK